MKVVVLSMVFAFAAVSAAQKIKIETVSEHHELPKYQSYQNSPPNGYLESISCNDGWKFVVIKGEFKEGLKFKGEQIYLTTKSNKKYCPVGCMQQNGIPYLDYRGYSKFYEGVMTPIFALEEGEDVESLYLDNQQIALPALSPDVAIELNNKTQITVEFAQYQSSLEFEYKLAPADKNWVKEAIPQFKRKINPVCGELLYVEMGLGAVEGFDCNELSVFSESGFSSTPVGYKRERADSFSYFGSIRSNGKYVFVFIAPPDQKSMTLYFRNRKVCAFEITDQ